MANSSFGALVLLMLAVAAAVLMVTPQDRGPPSLNPGPFWSAQR